MCEKAFFFLSIVISKSKNQESDDNDLSLSSLFTETILNTLIQCKADKNASIGSILALRSYLSALEHDAMVSELARLFLPQLLAINNEIMGEILKIIHEMKEEDYASGSENLARVLNCYEVEITFIECIYNVIKDCMIKQGRGAELFLMNTGMANLLFQIIGVVGTRECQCQQVLISHLDVPPLDLLINRTKKTALNILNYLLKLCLRVNLETRLLGNNLVYMQYMILTLCWTTSKKNFIEELDADDESRGICIALLENISLCSKSKIFADLLAKMRGKLITEILLMYLTTPEKERIDAEEAPTEFLNLALDVCDRQESMTIKSQAAKCLESLCTKVDG